MDNLERIDRYLSGEMDASEKQAFDAEVAANPQLAEELALQRDMNTFLRGKDRRDALQNQLKNIGGDYFKTVEESAKIVQMPRRRLRWMIAASAAAVIVTLIVWQFLFSPSLYDQYATYAPLALAEKSATTITDWSQTESAFNSGDYRTAEAQLTQYLTENPNDQLARLYLGICKMELNQLAEAQQIFQSFEDADASIKDYADWYLALSYLKAKDEESCRRILQRITPASSLYEQANSLLSKL
ncbi:MAG: tetratricopeptide repeat protein [Saprospiraceae bacterium]|nr:tetratricopeptide repeat protein [Saprospiraceae bacterium]